MGLTANGRINTLEDRLKVSIQTETQKSRSRKNTEQKIRDKRVQDYPYSSNICFTDISVGRRGQEEGKARERYRQTKKQGKSNN